MVQVFAPSPAAMQRAQIGQSIGQGISTKLGLAEAEKLASSSEQDPVKLAFALAKASNYAPGLERSLGQIYQSLMERGQSNQLATGLTGGKSNLPSNALNQPKLNEIQNDISPTGVEPNSMDIPLPNKGQITAPLTPTTKKEGFNSKDVENVSHEYLMRVRPDLVQGSSSYGRIPSFNFQSQSDLRTDEEQQLRQDLIQQKYTPKAIESIIQRAREDIKTKYNEKLKAFDIDVTQQGDINKKWETFKQRSNEYLQPLLGKYDSSFGFGGKPNTANDLKNKYFQYAQSLPVNLTPEQMHAQAGSMLQRDVNRIDALSAIPALPFIRDPKDVEENIKDRKEAYRELAKEGYYETLKEDAVNNGGMGLEELHYTLYGDQTDKVNMNLIADLKAPKLYLSQKYPIEIVGGTPIANPNYAKERKSYVDNLSSRLMKIKPDDDLVLLRAQALNSGAQQNDFTDALLEAQEKGLKLSPFQESQQQEVRIPRQRPIWEIFNPNAWSSWINHLRGKR